MKTGKDSRLLNIYIPLFLVLAGFFFKLFFIGQRDICIDEPFTIFSAQKSLGEIINITRAGEPNPPLFMILLHFWIKIFGISPTAVRLLPLIFNALTVLFIYFTGKRFIGFWAGMVASGLFLLSNHHFFHGLETRTYSLVSLETAASLYFFLRYAENQKDRKALAGLILANIMLVYSHHFGWFVIFSQIIASLCYTRNLKMFLRFLIPAGATITGYAPMIPIIIRQFISKKTRGTWLDPPEAFDYLNELFFFLNHRVVFWVVTIVIGAGLIFTLIMIILKRGKRVNIILPVLLLYWILPYSIMFFASFNVPMFISKYILFNSIGFYLFLGALIHFLYQKNKFVEPLVGLLVLIYMFHYTRFFPDYFAFREVKKSVDFVKNAENENSIIILYPYWSSFQFNYYYDQEIFKDHRNYDERLKNEGIYRVWGLPNTKSIIAAHPDKRIIYLQDESIKPREASIFGFLDSAMVKVDSVHFRENFNIGVYEPGRK